MPPWLDPENLHALETSLAALIIILQRLRIGQTAPTAESETADKHPRRQTQAADTTQRQVTLIPPATADMLHATADPPHAVC
jgi:hypothetical protein